MTISLPDAKRELLRRRLAGGSFGAATAAIPPASHTRSLPLSAAQESIWGLQELDPGAPTFNVPIAWQLDGPLDIERLQRALDSVVARHGALRLRIAIEEGRLVQHQEEALGCSLAVIDATDAGDAQRRVLEEARRPFDLGGPLVRATLFRISPVQTCLALTLHHLVCDGWSIGLLLRELAAAYVSGNAAGARPVQFIDLLEWRARQLAEQPDRPARAKAYWRDHLAGAPVLSTFPSERPRPALRDGAGRRITLPLDASLWPRVTAFAQANHVTPFMVLGAVYALMLGRHAGQKDVVIGTPASGRDDPATAHVVGLLTEPVALRVALDAPHFAALVTHLKDGLLGAFDHPLPLTEVVAAAELVRSTSHMTPFQTEFTFTAGGSDVRPFGDELAVKPLPVDLGVAKYDLLFDVFVDGGRLQASVEYATERYGEAEVRQLVERYGILCDGALAFPAQPLAELPMLDAEERTRLLVEWNSTEVAGSDFTNLYEWLEAVASAHPEAVALADNAGSVLYHELFEGARRLAVQLRAAGCGPDKLCALYLPRSREAVQAILGILASGAAYLPVDPEHPAARTAFMLDEAQPLAIVTTRGLARSLPEPWRNKACCLDELPTVGPRDGSAGTDSRAEPSDLAYVLYTSGSTGKPKGVAITHRGLLNYLAFASRSYFGGRGRGSLLHSPLSFDLTVTSLFGPLLCGQTLHILPQEADIETLARAITHHGRGDGLAMVKLTPAHLDLLNGFLDFDAGSWHIDTLVVGGEALADQAIEPWRRSRAVNALINEYGPTETVVGCAVFDAMLDSRPRPSLPIGRPIDNTRLYVLDESLAPVPVGVQGRLFIAGRGVARGYLRRPELTRERFVRDPFDPNPAATMYDTGDLARWFSDGMLEYLGRSDDQVKVRGYRIELGEIELRLREAPGVVEVAVAVVAGRAGQRTLAGYVVPAPHTEVDEPALLAHLRERLPDYMIPERILGLASLPLTANGKVDRAALPMPQAGAPTRGRSPSTALEQRLLPLFRETLQAQVLGVDDHFLDAGGNSILAGRLVLRLREATGTALALRAFYERPTVAGVAAVIEALQAQPGGSPQQPLRRVDRDRPVPLSLSQQRLWVLYQMAPDSPFYNVTLAMSLASDVDADALTRSVDALLRRHEPLRTCFESVDGIAMQRVLSPPAAVLSTVEVEDRAQCQAVLDITGQRPFRLESELPLRATWARTPDGGVLQLDIHHLVCDAWSSQLLLAELRTIYEAEVSGREASLRPLPFQYVDYADWQRRDLDDARLNRLRDHWAGRLAGVPPVVTFTPDRPRRAEQRYRGARFPFEVDTTTVQRLRMLGRSRGRTLFAALLAGYGVLLARASGLQDVVVGVPTAGRDRVEAEPMVGFFSNLLPLRLTVAHDTPFIDLLDRAGGSLQDALDHQQLPFEQIVAHVQPVRSPGHAPLAQTRFGMQDIPASVAGEGGTPAGPSHDGVPRGEFASSRFDVGFYLWEQDGAVRGQVVYDTDLYEHESARGMADGFLRVLQAAVEAPDTPVGRLPVAGEDAVPAPLPAPQRTLVESVHSGLQDVHERIAQLARQQADKHALVHAGEALTYGDLELRACRLAAALRSAGSQPGERIGIHLPRSIDIVVAILAVLKTGCAYVPLDPGYPPARRLACAIDAQIALCIGDGTDHVALPELAARWVDVAASRDVSLLPPTPAQPSPASDRPAYFIHTSGTTGKPKGVVVGHHALKHYVAMLADAVPLAGVENFLHTAPFSFSSSVRQLFVPLTLGATCHIASRETIADPLRLFSQVQESGVEVLDLVPSYLQACTDVLLALSPAERAGLLGNRLRWILTASEPLPAALVRQWYDELAHPAAMVNMYGQTETCGIVCIHPVPRDAAAEGAVPIGRPLAGTQVWLLDDHGEPVPRGSVGEIVVGGRQLALGYSDAPLPTTASGGYRTGDFGRLDPLGQLVHLGRGDDVVKIRGHRVHLIEVEQALRADPQVSGAAVIRVEEPDIAPWLAAVIVPRAGSRPESLEVLRRLHAREPAYRVPARLLIVETLPVTPNGKVDRAALRLLLDERSHLDATGARPSAQAGSPAADTLLRLFRQVLKRKDIQAGDNFFEVGGDSLSAIRVVHQARKAGLQLTTAQFMAAPSAASLAAAIAPAGTGDPVAQPTVSPLGDVPLTPSHCAFFGRQLHDSARRAAPVLFDLTEAIDPQSMSAAVAAVVAHHDALRLVFRRQGDSYQPYIRAEEAETPFSWHDLSGLEPEACSARQSEIARAVLTRFDLERGPLLHIAVLHFGAGRGDRLAVLVHHQLTDAASTGMLLDDLAAAYHALRAGESPSLPPAGAPFRAWALRLREHADSRAVRAQLPYWVSCVEPARDAHFPLQHAGGTNLIATARTVSVDFTPDQTAALQARGHLRDRVVSAMAAALCASSGRRRLLFAMPERGRERVFGDLDVSRTFGRFAIATQVLVDVDPGRSAENHLQWIREQMAAIPERGEAHGLLRHLASDAQARQQLAGLEWPRIMCEYRGEYEASTSTSAFFGMPKADDRWQPEGGTRQYEIYVVSDVAVGALQVRWGYSPELHDPAKIGAVAADFRRRMEAMLDV